MSAPRAVRTQPTLAVVRLIFLNRFFHPDHSATSQLLSDLAFALASSGHVVTVMTSRHHYDGSAMRLPKREIVAGVDVHRLSSPAWGRHNLVGRLFSFIGFYLLAGWKLWRLTRRGDVVIAMTDPPMLSVLAVPIARARGARSVNWLQDLFPEVAERLGVGGPGARVLFAMLQPLRNLSLKSADKNVVLGERMAQTLADLGITRQRIAVIPNWADGKAIVPISRIANPTRHHWGLGDTFVVAYSGNLGRAHEIETMLQAIELMAHRQPAGPPIAWLFVGGGSRLADLKVRLAHEGIGACFKDYQPREALAQSLSAGDLHLISLRSDLEGLIVPSKLYGIAAAGRPAIFIGAPDGEIAAALTRLGSGLSVAEGDGRGLADAILSLAADPTRCAQMGAAARQGFEFEFDRPLALARWQALLDALPSEKGRAAADMVS